MAMAMAIAIAKKKTTKNRYKKQIFKTNKKTAIAKINFNNNGKIQWQWQKKAMTKKETTKNRYKKQIFKTNI
jgi:hypothetical protein